MNDMLSLMPARPQGDLLALNAETETHGLRLSPAQAVALRQTETAALDRTGRIEFGDGAAQALIRAFCDSPYLTQENLEETLCALIEMFYTFKNETLDAISDGDLIGCMKSEFDNSCHGSMELLTEALDRLARRVRAGER